MAIPGQPPGLDEWLKLVIVTLNAMWLEGAAGWFKESCYGSDQPLTKCQVLCFWHLERAVESFLGAVPATLPAEPAAAFLERKRVTYTGDVVSRCEVLTWAQAKPAAR